MPQSSWITHVKKYAAENNVSYKEALSKASASYKKQKGEGCCDKLRGRNQNRTHPEQDYTPTEQEQAENDMNINIMEEENDMNLESLKSPRQKNIIYVKPIKKKKKKKNKK